MPDDDDYASTQGFEILSDETRIGILEALAEEFREDPDNPSVGFSDLRRAVGMRDSGNFNYHLDQLEGRFVLKTDEGYRIAPAGIEVVAALVAGVYGETEGLGPVELEDPCPICGQALTATYENSLFVVSCPDDHVFRNTLPPGAIDDRTIDEIIELLTIRTKQHLEMAVNGICPFCQGQLSWDIEPDTEFGLPEFENQCSRCGVRVEVPAVAPLLTHPAAITFFHEHGINVRKQPLWAPEFYNKVQIETASDPVELSITVELDGDCLTATLDGQLRVIDIDN